MPKRPETYVAELNITLEAMTSAAQDGFQVIQITLSTWTPPELLVVSRPDLDDMPGAHVRGPAPGDYEQWAASYHGCLLTWFRDLPRSAA